MRYILLCALAACTDNAEPEPFISVNVSRVDFGPVTCGDFAQRGITVSNIGEPVEVEASIDNPDIEIKTPHFTVDTDFASGLFLVAHPHARGDATLTLTTATQTLHVPVTMIPSGIHARLDPPALDFGKVLPDVTKELTVTVTTDNPGTVPVTLGDSSTPRFEIVGSHDVLASATSTTFTVRLISSSQPATHTGTIPITSQAGVCVPTELPMTATTVP